MEVTFKEFAVTLRNFLEEETGKIERTDHKVIVGKAERCISQFTKELESVPELRNHKIHLGRFLGLFGFEIKDKSV